MKRIIIGIVFILVSIFATSMLQTHLFEVLSATDYTETIGNLSNAEYTFFDKKNKEQEYSQKGMLVVDSINGGQKETFLIDDTVIEKDAVITTLLVQEKDKTKRITD
ncbi:MAG: hypothetical protein K9L02_07290 [Acholeplasmataceae bacterium]|nr:hypothetical protein [Acholeplasmataceae bacterium]